MGVALGGVGRDEGDFVARIYNEADEKRRRAFERVLRWMGLWKRGRQETALDTHTQPRTKSGRWQAQSEKQPATIDTLLLQGVVVYRGRYPPVETESLASIKKIHLYFSCAPTSRPHTDYGSLRTEWVRLDITALESLLETVIRFLFKNLSI
jgi:hypothetical protein